jgi:hypothetical protein
LLGVAGVAGLFFSLYRNDVLLGVARSGGWEPRYLAFEARLLGRPGWGTPRSLTAELGAAKSELSPAAAAPDAAAAATLGASAVSEPAPAAPAVTGTTAPVAASPARATSDGVKIVSLDALATLPAEPARAAAPAPVPARHVADNPAPARAVTTERAAPIAKAPVAKAPVAKAPVAKAPAAAAPPANENPLKAAIRTAIVKESQAK